MNAKFLHLNLFFSRSIGGYIVKSLFKAINIPTLVVIALLLQMSSPVFSQITYTTITNGTWSVSGTWDGNGVPPDPLPNTDSIIVKHTVTYDQTQEVLGVMIIEATGSVLGTTRDLDIGKGGIDLGELINYGTILVRELEVKPELSCTAGHPLPYIENYGDITTTIDLDIGRNCGAGSFFNRAGGTVTVGSRVHLDGYLCNADTMYVTDSLYVHGGTIDCCGFIEAGNVHMDNNAGLPATLNCMNVCGPGGTAPVLNVDGTYFSDANDLYNNAPTSKVVSDPSFTTVCGVSAAAGTSAMRGAGISYECLGANTYQVALDLYRDCNNPIPTIPQIVSWTSPSCGLSGSLVANLESGFPIDISPVCPTAITTCAFGFVPGVQHYRYVATITFPNGCNDITFSWTTVTRNTGITNLSAPSSQSMYVEASLDGTASPCNSSPTFLNEPLMFACSGTPMVYNNAAFDADGDSLSYSLVDCESAAGTSVNYSGTFSGTNPFTGGSSISIDAESGHIMFNASGGQDAVICVQVDEFRGGVLIGSIVRDILLSMSVCTNALPALSGIDGTPGNTTANFQTTVCPNTPLCFFVNGTDVNTSDALSLTYDNSISGATFTTGPASAGAPNSLDGQFCWTPLPTDIGKHHLTLTIEDDACDLIGKRVYTYSINVVAGLDDPVVAGPDVEICDSDSAQLTATSTAPGVTYMWSPAIGLSNPNIPNPKASPGTSLTYTVTAAYPSGCITTDDVSVTVKSAPTVSTTPDNLNVCAGSNVVISGVTNALGMTFAWTDLNATATGYPIFPAGSTGTVNGTTTQLSIAMYSDPGIYLFQLEVTDPTTGCTASSIVILTVGVQPPPTCNHIYASTTGIASNAGTRTSPVTIEEAITRAACNRTVIKLATGTYNIDAALNMTNYLTLEGGFMEASNWKKTSVMGATTIHRTVNNLGGTANQDQHITAIEAYSAEYFRLQDLSITTANAVVPGVSTYGLYLNNCSNYRVTRVNIQPGNATKGVDGAVGCSGSNGGIGINGINGLIDAVNPDIRGGKGGDGANSCGSAAFLIGGAGGRNFDVGNGTGNGADGFLATPGVVDGGAGGGGGRGGPAGTGGTGGAGEVGGTPFDSPTSGCSATASGLGSSVAGGDGGTANTVNTSIIGFANGTPGDPGDPGVDGLDGCDGAAGAMWFHTSCRFHIGGKGILGMPGSGGSGGGGGGGGGGQTCPACADGTGNGGGGGGGGAAAGLGGLGALGGGASFGIYICGNGVNGDIKDCFVEAGSFGAGGDGGAGGTGGIGGTGGLGANVGIAEIQAGGNGGKGGDGGTGGDGGDGQAGIAVDIYWDGNGSMPVNQDSIFDLATQQEIHVADVNCTNTPVLFQDPALPGGGNVTNWNFDLVGSSATPLISTANPETTQYPNLGRYNIEHGAGNVYTDFHLIALSGGAKPDILTSANRINPDTFQVCVGDFPGFASSVVGDTFNWNFNGAITNPGDTQYVANIQFNTAGFYPVELYLSNSCCGASAIDTIWLLVAPKPAVTGPSNVTICAGGFASLVLNGLTTSDTVVWTPSSTVTVIQKDSVVVNPTVTTTYTASVVSMVTLGSKTYAFCPISIPVTVTVSGGISTNIIATPILCVGDSAQISVNAVGGQAPLTYTWSGGSSAGFPANQDIVNGAIAGSYFVTVTDALGCEAVTDIFISEPSAITATISSQTNVSCKGGNDGILTVSGAGGVGGLSFSWDAAAGGRSGPTVTDLIAGSYCVSVEDINGCIEVICATILEPAIGVTSSTTVVSDYNGQNISCVGANDGIAVTTASGGTPSVISGYTYQWDAAALNQVTDTAFNLTAGIYFVTITDSLGCEVRDSINLISPAPLLAPISGQTNVACLGGATGQATVGPTGGVSPYSYVWDAAALAQTTQTATGLLAGSYDVTTTDANNCEVYTTVNISQPPNALVAQAVADSMLTCVGFPDGGASAVGAGGTPTVSGQYSYLWDGGQTTNAITGLAPATYFVTITDSLGCTDSASILITQPTGVSVTLVSSTNITCFGDSTGTMTVAGAGGVGGPYTFDWGANANNQTTATATGLQAGVLYCPIVRDINGCAGVLCNMLIQPTALSVSAVVASDYNGAQISCFGAGDGAATAIVSGGTLTYNYSWNTSETTDTIINLSPIAYTVTVTDGNGCTATDGVTLVQPTFVSAFIISSVPVTCFGDSTGQMTALGTDGTGALSYLWSNGQTTTVATGLQVANNPYRVSVTDANGCLAIEANNLTQGLPVPTPDIGAISTSVCEGENIQLTTSTVATNYYWSSPPSFVSNIDSPVIFSAVISDGGTYSLHIEDANGCTSADTSIVITVNPAPLPVTIIGGGPICTGKSFTIEDDGSGVCDSFSWIGPVTPQLGVSNLVTVNPGDANYVTGIWTMHCVNTTTGCMAVSNPVFVNLLPTPPTPVPTSSGPVCIGDSVDLSVPFVLAANVNWYTDTFALPVAIGSNVTIFNLTTTTTFFVKYATSNCHSSFGAITVTVNPIPATPDVPGDITICEGQDINLFTNATAASYNWSHGGTPISNQQTFAISPSVLTDAGVYTLAIVDSNGCSSADSSLTVTIQASPSISTITGPGTICDGDSLAFTGLGGCDSTYWYGPGGGIYPSGSMDITLPSTIAAADYVNGGAWEMLCVDTTSGCSSKSNVVIVNINPAPPVPPVFNNGPVCTGDSVGLMVPLIGGATYTWYGDSLLTVFVANGSNPFVQNMTQDSTFYVEINVGGCSSIAQTLVSVNQLSSPASIPADFTVCEGDSIFLTTTTAADAYLWAGPTGLTASIPNPILVGATLADSGIYTLSIIDTNGCPAPDTSLFVTVVPQPLPPVISSNPICEGDTLFLFASGGCDSIEWTGPDGTAFVGSDTIFVLSGNINYVINGAWRARCMTNGCQSASTAIHNVVINPIPTPPTIIHNAPVCVGESVQLLTPQIGTATYEWLVMDTVTLIGTTTLINIPINSDTAFLLVMTLDGCSSSDSVQVTVHPQPPAPDVPDTIQACQNDTIFLTTTTIQPSYYWSGPNGFSSVLQNPFIYPASAVNDGFYTLVIKDANFCASLDTTVRVIVNAPPATPTISTPNTSVCLGDTIFVNSSGGCDQSLWTGPSGGPPFWGGDSLVIDFGTPHPEYMPGDWTMRCIDTLTGCHSISNTLTITINNAPPPPVITHSAPICIGDSVALSMAFVPGATNYLWYSPDSILLGTSQNLTVHGLTNDTAFYGVVVVNGCSAFDSVQIIVNPLPPVPDAFATLDTVCEFGFIQLNTTIAPPIIHNWSGPNGFTSNTQNPFILSVNAVHTGAYSLNIIDGNGCQSLDTTIQVVVNPTPSAPVITGTASVCIGDTIHLQTDPCHELTWIYTGAGPSPPPVVMNGVFNLDIAPGTAGYLPGFWQVSCTDTITGCASQVSAPFPVSLDTLPAVVLPTNSGPVCVNESAFLIVPPQAVSSFIWSTDSLFTDTIGIGNVIAVDSISSDSTFYVQVTNINGCSTFGATTVTVNPVPSSPIVAAAITEVCEGDSILLEALNGVYYFWSGPNGFLSTEQFPIITTATVAQSGYYVAYTEDSIGCASPADSVLITVNAPPSAPIISGGSNICNGDTIILTSTVSCDSSVWTGSAGTLAGVGNQLSIAEFALGYTNATWTLICHDTSTGCSATSNTIFVNLLAAPSIPIINNSGPVCNDDSVILTTPIVVGATNIWYSDSLLTDSIGIGNNTTVLGITSDTTFYLAQTVNGCSAPIASTSVTHLTIPPTPIVPSGFTVCIGDTIYLGTTTPGDAYLWTNSATFTSTLQNPTIAPATAGDAGLYTLSLIDTNGCAAPNATILVGINPPPVAPLIYINDPICAGDTMDFGTNFPLNVKIEWVTPNNDTILGSPDMHILSSNPNYLSGLWTVIFTDTVTGCQITEDSVFTIDVPPTQSLVTNSGPVCVGDSVILTTTAVAGAVNYLWYNSDVTLLGTGLSLVVSNITTDTAMGLMVNMANGCNYFMDSTFVFVQPQSPAPPIQVDTFACLNDLIQFNTAPAAAYNWTGPNGFTSTLQNPTISVATIADSGLYTLVITDINGCASADSSINVQVNPSPIAPVATGPSVICQGDTLFLTSTNSGCDSIYWLGPNGLIVGGANIAIASTNLFYFNVTGDWQVFCLDTMTGCQTGSNIINVTVNPKSVATAINNGPACLNGTVSLTAGFVPGVTYLWYTDSLLTNNIGSTQVILVDSITTDSTFYLVLIDSMGCSSAITSTTVTLQPLAPAPNIGPDIHICEGDNFTLTTAFNLFGYNWSGPNGFVSNQWLPTITNATLADSGTYTLSIVGLNGCNSADTTLQVIIDSLPDQPTIPPFVYLCEGDTLFLVSDSTANHCDSVAWIGPNGVNYPVLGRNVAIPPGDTNHIGGLWQLRCIDTTTTCDSRSNLSLVIIAPIPVVQPTYTTGPVCLGGSVTLSTDSAGIFASYTWYADSTLTNIVGTGQYATINGITSDTTFYLVITNLGACNSVAIPTPVTVLPPGSAPSVPADIEVCVGSPIALTTTTITSSYFWSGQNGFVDTIQNPTVTVAATVLDSGIYTLIVIDSNGCVSSDTSLHITVNALPPIPSITSNSPLCDGDTLHIESSSQCGQSQWIGPLGNSSTVLGTPGGGNILWTLESTTAIPPGDSSYVNGSWTMVCIDTITGCQSVSDSIVVTINPSPVVISVANNGPVCFGDSVGLTINATASSGIVPSFVWYSDAALTTPVAVGATPFIHNITATTTFYVQVTDPVTGCTISDSTTVGLNAVPATPSVPADMILCEGDSIVLITSTVAPNYNWTGPNGFSSAQANPPSFASTVLDSGNYSLSIIDSLGCTSVAAIVHVSVNPSPQVATVTNNGPGCTGDSIALSASTIVNATYEWFKLPLGTSVGLGQNISLTNLSLVDTGSYYVVVTLNGCSSSSDSTVVSVYANSGGTAYAGVDQILCGEDSTTLSATAPTGTITGLWTSGTGVAIASPNSATTLVANLPQDTTEFYWTLSNANCPAFAVDTVLVIVTPQSMDVANAGVSQNLCGSTTTSLAASPTTTSTGMWTQDITQSNLGVVIADSTDPTSSISGLIPGNQYTFVWELTNGLCGVYSTDTIVVDISIAPSDIAFAGNNIVTCSQDTIILAASNPTVGAGMWTTNSSAIIITPTQNNTIVTNLLQDTTMFVWTLSNGVCVDYSVDTVFVILGGGNAGPIAFDDNWTVTADGIPQTITVINNDINLANWDSLSFNPGTTGLGQLVYLGNGDFEITLQSSDTGNQVFTYTLCETTCGNCNTATVYIEVSQLTSCDIPNIFTPNGDNVNDQFIIPCLSDLQQAQLIVFNRWGDLVYETDSYVNQWQGTHNGQALPDGTYFYIIRLNGEEKQGSVEIRR